MKIDILETKVNYKSNDIAKDNKSKNEFVSVLDEKALDSITDKDINNSNKNNHNDAEINDNLNEILFLLLNKLNIINNKKLQSIDTENVKQNFDEVINTIKNNLNNNLNNNVNDINEINKLKKLLELLDIKNNKNFSEIISKNDITNIKNLNGDFKNEIDSSLSDLKNYILNIFNEKTDKLSSENLVVNRNILKVSKDDIDILNNIALDKDKFNKNSTLNINNENTTKSSFTDFSNKNINIMESGQLRDNKISNVLTIKNNNLDNGKEKNLDSKNKVDNILENKNSTLDRSTGISNLNNLGNVNLNNSISDNGNIVVRREFIKNDIVQAISYLKNSESEEINVTMNPKELGSMKISIIKTEDKSSYLISIANKDTLLMIKDNLSEIKSHLINMNFDNREVNIEVKLSNFGNTFNEDGNGHFNRNNNREEKKERTLIKKNDSELENTVVEDTNINLLI